MTNDIRNVVTGVRRWAKRLRGKGKEHAWSDFMVSKFHHMEEGSYNCPLSDIDEIGDRILQWGSHLDKKRVELRQYFPPSQTSPNTTSNSTHGPSGNKVNATGKSSQRSHAPRDSKTTTYSTTHVTSPPPGTETCTYCGKMHPLGLALRTHPDANTNENIPLKKRDGKEHYSVKRTWCYVGHPTTVRWCLRYDGACG